MNKLTLITSALLAGAALVSFDNPEHGSSCNNTAAKPAAFTGSKNIVETALAAGQFTTLAKALDAAGLADALQGEGPFTVFAPTDAAFSRIPAEKLAALLTPENRGTLQNILTFHVVSGKVGAADVVKMDKATALNGQRLPIATSDAGVRVAGAKVVRTDIECSNGVIHVIDSVMMPATKDIVETAVGAGSFKTLAAALQAGGLVEALQGEGPFTVFAPTDDAFAALPEQTLASLLKPENKDKLVAILKYHVVPGRIYADQLESGHVATLGGAEFAVDLSRGVRINNAGVQTADIEASNGVIHVIDKVLLPQ